MSRTSIILKLARQANLLTTHTRPNPLSTTYYSTMLQHSKVEDFESPKNTIALRNPTPLTSTRIGKNVSGKDKLSVFESPKNTIAIFNPTPLTSTQIGKKLTGKDKHSVFVNKLMELEDSKEALYSTLDAWVATKPNFPIGPLKNALVELEKQNQWHRVIQVIKWMLSKGQGTTLATYGHLIQALDMDHRVKEAHWIWYTKLERDLHLVPWKLCNLMIGVYYRNKMFEDLVYLFRRLERLGRKPPNKSIVQGVADAHEALGLLEDKKKILDKYKGLFCRSEKSKPSRRGSSVSPKKTKPRQKTQ